MPVTHLYALELRGGKVYIGQTENPTRRLREHVTGEGCAWTRLHKPLGRFLELVKCKTPAAASLEEDHMTERYMMGRGIDNVRGGSYSARVLTQEQRAVLQNKRMHAENRCLSCGKLGHFSSRCPVRTAVTHPKRPAQRKTTRPTGCRRCGREGHDAQQCYARTHNNGSAILWDEDDEDDDEHEDECGGEDGDECDDEDNDEYEDDDDDEDDDMEEWQ